jgi:hypothetical protein
MSSSSTQPGSPRPSSGQRALKRYGPLAVVAALVVGAIVILGGGDDDDDVAGGAGGNGEEQAAPVAEQEGTLLTFQEAEEQGEDIDFGEGCDPETGRVAIPLRSAAPCVEPFEEGADNGGATSPGVTADAIKIVVYKGQPDPLTQAAVGAAGADTDPNAVNQTALDYLTMFEDVYELYGRRLDVEVVEATGGASDATAALADAQTVIDKQPFAVVGGPGQTEAYWQEIANAGILCMGGCTLAEGWENVEAAAPTSGRPGSRRSRPTPTSPSSSASSWSASPPSSPVTRPCTTPSASSGGCRRRPRPASTPPATTPSTSGSRRSTGARSPSAPPTSSTPAPPRRRPRP